MAETIYINCPPCPFGEHTTAIRLNGWSVVNAPRPLPGAVTWQGEFRHGIFYAAGPLESFHGQWSDLDAWPVQEITNLQVAERIARMAKDCGTSLAEVLSDFDGNMAAVASACDLPWFVSTVERV